MLVKPEGRKFACVLALEDGTAIGEVCLDRFPAWVWISDFIIYPQWQGQGHGTRMMDEVMKLLDGRAARLTVDADNAVAIRLYEKFGFARIGGEQILTYERAADK
jgi:RimJ/RimL family protein N-acetyltransferase